MADAFARMGYWGPPPPRRRSASVQSLPNLRPERGRPTFRGPPPLVPVRSLPPRRLPQPNVIEDFFSTVLALLTDTYVLAVLIGIGLIIFAHVDDGETGPLHKLIDGLMKNKGTMGIGKFISENLKKVVGFLCFLPTILILGGKRRMYASIVIIIWLFTAVEYSALEYSIQAFSAILFFKLKVPIHRVIVLCTLAFYLYVSNVAETKEKKDP